MLWGQAIAGVVIVSGLTVAVTAPAEENAGHQLSVQQAHEAGARGLRVGSAIVTPSLDVAGSFDTNVFAAPNRERSDWFASFTPRLDVESDLPRHSFSIRAQGEFRQYATYTRENVGNASVAGTGRLDLAANAYVLAGGSHQRLHEDRGALVPVNGINPTRFTVTSGKAGFVIEPSPLGLRLDATIDSYAFSNVTLFGGAIVNETARNRVVYALQPRISYRIVPQYDAFIRAVVNRRQYGSRPLPDGLGRSSTGSAVDFGSAFNLPGFAAGEFYLGYLRQNYDARQATPITAVNFGGNVEWRPTDATSFRLDLTRSVEESAMLGSPGFLQTAVRFGIANEVAPRLLLLGSVGYVNADFARGGGGGGGGGGAVGNSNLYQAKIGAQYLVAANVSAGLEYNVGHRASSAALPNYTRQIIELRVRGQL